jgi:hypothetical protein
MAGTGIQSFAKLRAQIVRGMPHKPRCCFRPVAFRSQTYCGMPTITLQLTAECQLHGKICRRMPQTEWLRS